MAALADLVHVTLVQDLCEERQRRLVQGGWVPMQLLRQCAFLIQPLLGFMQSQSQSFLLVVRALFGFLCMGSDAVHACLQ
eukprot:36910-Eustigmatos_ZCMA.PRE.1